MGRISDSTIALAALNPYGNRIVSGVVTVNVVFALANHYSRVLSPYYIKCSVLTLKYFYINFDFKHLCLFYIIFDKKLY